MRCLWSSERKHLPWIDGWMEFYLVIRHTLSLSLTCLSAFSSERNCTFVVDIRSSAIFLGVACLVMCGFVVAFLSLFPLLRSFFGRRLSISATLCDFVFRSFFFLTSGLIELFTSPGFYHPSVSWVSSLSDVCRARDVAQLR